MSEMILPRVISTGIYNSDVALKNVTVTRERVATAFEIDLPIENGGIAFIDSEEFQIAPNTVICVKPGQTRHTRLPLKCYFIHMALEKGALYDALMKIPTFLPTPIFSEYLHIFKSLYKHRDAETESSNIILQSLILKLIYKLSMDSKKQVYAKSFGPFDYDRINRAIEYVKEHISENLSLEKVSSIASYSSPHFHNCFKAVTGKTLHEYVEDLRIQKAVILLSTTTLTLTEIASRCGFSSQSYFSYVFKRKMNMTPRDYVKEEYKRYLP